MRAVITVIGQDKVGIIASVSAALSECNVNILDITQTTMQGMFTMIMLTDISGSSVSFSALSEKLAALGEKINLQISVQHEDIFNSMHRI